MVASVPDKECICPRFDGICRAHHVVLVPLSQVVIALLGSLLPSSHATTCGFIGLSVRVERSSIVFHQSFIPSCAVSKNLRFSFLRRRGMRVRRVCRLSPTRPTSAGNRKPI